VTARTVKPFTDDSLPIVPYLQLGRFIWLLAALKANQFRDIGVFRFRAMYVPDVTRV
jgi:hypothetical protein